MCSPLKVFLHIVPLKATKYKWRFQFWLRGVQFVSAVCCTPRISSVWCVAQRGDFFETWRPWLHSMLHTIGDLLRAMLHTGEIFSTVCTEMVSTVSNTPLKSSPRYVAHRGDFSKFDALNSAVCCTPRRLSPWCDAHCTLPRLTPRCATHRGIISTECCTPRRFFRHFEP